MNRGAIIAGVLIGAFALYNYRQRRRPARIIPVPNRPGGFNANTVPPFGIFIQKSQINNQALIDHERTHWRQYMQQGLIPYYFNYASQIAAYGYDHMPMEIEARSNEAPWVKNNYTISVRNGWARTVHNPNFRK